MLGEVDRVDLLDDGFITLAGVTVREARLELLAGLISLVTLAGVALRVVVLGKVDWVDLLDDAFATLPGMIVREVRLEPLAEEVDTVRVCGAADWLLVAVLATSTVRLTGRVRVALLRVERLEDVWDEADTEGVDGVDLLD